MADFSPVVFNDGQPLDLDQLRKMATNLQAMYTQINNVYAALTNGQSGNTASIPVMDANYVTFSDGLKVGSNGPLTIAFSVKFPGSTPFVVASITTNLGKVIASPYVVSDANGKYSIYVSSNAIISSPVTVSWMAFSPKIITV
jgi:hypothetical protein